jgi:hypothetical protein
LDYLFASKEGVCGKVNLSNCCLQIPDEEKVTEEITDRMRKLAHVPIQTWRGWDSILMEDGSLPRIQDPDRGGNSCLGTYLGVP